MSQKAASWWWVLTACGDGDADKKDSAGKITSSDQKVGFGGWHAREKLSFSGKTGCCFMTGRPTIWTSKSINGWNFPLPVPKMQWCWSIHDQALQKQYNHSYHKNCRQIQKVKIWYRCIKNRKNAGAWISKNRLRCWRHLSGAITKQRRLYRYRIAAKQLEKDRADWDWQKVDNSALRLKSCLFSHGKNYRWSAVWKRPIGHISMMLNLTIKNRGEKWPL